MRCADTAAAEQRSLRTYDDESDKDGSTSDDSDDDDDDDDDEDDTDYDGNANSVFTESVMEKSCLSNFLCTYISIIISSQNGYLRNTCRIVFAVIVNYCETDMWTGK